MNRLGVKILRSETNVGFSAHGHAFRAKIYGVPPEITVEIDRVVEGFIDGHGRSYRPPAIVQSSHEQTLYVVSAKWLEDEANNVIGGSPMSGQKGVTP